MPMNNRYSAHAPPRDDIDARTEPTILEFGTEWCGHCQRAQPLIAEALADHPQVQHLKIEDGPGRPLGRSYKVKLWPTVIFLRRGQEVDRVVRPADVDTIRLAMEKLTGEH